MLSFQAAIIFTPRSGFHESVFEAISAYAESRKKKLIIRTDSHTPHGMAARAYPFGIRRFDTEDYKALACLFLGLKRARNIEWEKVYEFAPKLDAHQLKKACHWLASSGEFVTEEFLSYLESQRLTSNVELEEVEAVSLSKLKGIDPVIEALETNIILPLENRELAEKYGLEGKRGVLLAGPPGTGKTTIGRALAHRLKGRFFLVDGTCISGSGDFYEILQRVFNAAKENAPGVIFIDDADVIFESGDHGLYRYLLTMLDGLESKSAGRVCVMMTAMNVSSMPAALVRSGRVELWLETQLPNRAARSEILNELLSGQDAAITSVNVETIAGTTEGLSGADMRRLVGDAKLLYAMDLSRHVRQGPILHYFNAALEVIRRNKEIYAAALTG